jgi:hypothetical protein
MAATTWITHSLTLRMRTRVTLVAARQARKRRKRDSLIHVTGLKRFKCNKYSRKNHLLKSNSNKDRSNSKDKSSITRVILLVTHLNKYFNEIRHLCYHSHKCKRLQ